MDKPDQSDKLDRIPTVWFVQCKYCNDNDFGRTGTRLHELELLDKARKMCRKLKTSHLEAYVTSELDRLDHSKMDTLGQIEILTAIHHRTGCDCLTDLTEHVTEATHTATADPAPQPPQPLISPKIRNHQHKPPTLMDRLKAGPTAQPKSTRT